MQLDDAFEYYNGEQKGEATPACISALFERASPTKQAVDATTQASFGAVSMSAPPRPELPLAQRRARMNLLKRLGAALSSGRLGDDSLKGPLSAAEDSAVAQSMSPARAHDITANGTAIGQGETLNGSASPSATPAVPSGNITISNAAEKSNTTLINASLPEVRTGNTSAPATGLAIPKGVGSPAAAGVGPPVHAFTGTARVYDFRLVTAYFTDPHLPAALTPIIEGNERMLKLYESGLPAWSVFFPSYGLYYRPWLRSLTWVLFYAFSFLSLAAGFWDLYKTLPGLQALLSRMVAGMWLPPAAVLQWIEEHAQIRLSLLLTYLFGKSEMFVYVVRVVGNLTRSSRAALEPLITALGPPAAAMRQVAAAAWTTVAALLQAGLAPLLAVLEWMASGAAAVIMPPIQALRVAVIVPATWIVAAGRQIGTAGSLVWTSLAGVGQGVATGVTAAKATARVGNVAGGAAVASSSWMLWLSPSEAVLALRGSVIQAARSAQAVWKAILNFCSTIVRHRLTLSRRAGRWWRRMKLRMRQLAWLPVAWALVLLQWCVSGLLVVGHTLFERQRKAKQAGVAANGSVAPTASAVANGQESMPDDVDVCEPGEIQPEGQAGDHFKAE